MGSDGAGESYAGSLGRTHYLDHEKIPGARSVPGRSCVKASPYVAGIWPQISLFKSHRRAIVRTVSSYGEMLQPDVELP